MGHRIHHQTHKGRRQHGDEGQRVGVLLGGGLRQFDFYRWGARHYARGADEVNAGASGGVGGA